MTDIVEAAGDIDCVLEVLSLRRGRHSNHARRHLLALLLERVHHVVRRKAVGLQEVRVQPYPHRILAGAKDVDVADTWKAGKFVLKIDHAVICKEKAVETLVRRGQREKHEDGGRLLLRRNPLDLHRLGQLRQRTRHPVLDKHLGHVRVSADLKGNDQRIGAVAGARRLHVDHAGHAVHLLLDGQRDRIHDDLGARARIARRHRNRWRRDVRVLRNGQPDEANRANEDSHERDDVREDGAFNEIARKHQSTPASNISQEGIFNPVIVQLPPSPWFSVRDSPSGRGLRAELRW